MLVDVDLHGVGCYDFHDVNWIQLRQYRDSKDHLHVDLHDMGDPIRIGKHWAAQTKPQALSMILNFTSS